MTKRFDVHLFEEHSASLPAWWSHPRANRTLVYLDAHLDLQQTREDGIDRLRQCRTLQDVRALESPHHLNPSERYAFGIEDFLHPASRLGLVGRLVWVAPPHVPRRYSRSLIEITQQMDGVEFGELAGFAPAADDALRGSLLGLDITICGYEQLATLDIGTYDLDIDTDYFVEVPADRLWVDPRRVVDAVVEQLGPPSMATVSRAVTSAFMPLACRFVGDYVRAVLEGDDEGCEHGARLFTVATATVDRKGAREACERARRARPDCPHTQYLAARLCDDPARARDLRSAAAAIDDGYRVDLSRDASAFPHRRLRLGKTALAGLAAALPSEVDEQRRALAELAVARLLAAAGRLDAAEALARRARGELADHGDLALAIARGHLAAGSAARALPWIETAHKRHKTRTVAAMMRGDLALGAGRARDALSCYEEAAVRAPAWQLPLRRRRDALRTLGDHAGAGALDKEIAHRQEIMDQLVKDAAGR